MPQFGITDKISQAGRFSLADEGHFIAEVVFLKELGNRMYRLAARHEWVARLPGSFDRVGNQYLVQGSKAVLAQRLDDVWRHESSGRPTDQRVVHVQELIDARASLFFGRVELLPGVSLCKVTGDCSHLGQDAVAVLAPGHL